MTVLSQSCEGKLLLIISFEGNLNLHSRFQVNSYILGAMAMLICSSEDSTWRNTTMRLLPQLRLQFKNWVIYIESSLQ